MPDKTAKNKMAEKRKHERTAGLFICLLGCAWATSADASAPLNRLPAPSAPSSGVAASSAPAANGQTPTPRPAGIAYTQKISGNLPSSLHDLMNEVTTLGRDNIPPPLTVAQLRRRARDQQTRYEEVLRSQGYYNGTVTTLVTGSGETGNQKVSIDFQIEPGKQFYIRSFKIRYIDNPSDAASLPDDTLKLGMWKNAPAQAARFIKFTQLELRYMADHGYPQARVAERRVVVDLSQQTADATLDVEAGPRLEFGNVKIEGLSDISPDYVRSYFKFHKGDLYDRRKVDATTKALRETGLFDTVALSSATPLSDGYLPQRLDLKQRVPRSIGAGVSWSTDSGYGAKAFWEHRNLFGAGESLRLSVDAAKIKQIGRADFRKPHYLRDDQSMIGTVELANEDTDAYTEKRFLISGGVERQITDIWAASVGLSYLKSTFTDSQGNGSADISGVPIGVRMNTSNDLLDPTEGARLNLTGAPYIGKASREPTRFIRAEGVGTHYLTLSILPELTFANRIRLGSLIGADDVRLPPSIRFYSGGGGSVRGYGYQKIGPLDKNLEPTGGSSVLEAGTELRYRLNETIGLVTFFEGGNVYEKSTPDFRENLFWGTGIGVRYYTPIGPIRADIGIPLDRRKGVDAAYQLYFSIGQAF